MPYFAFDRLGSAVLVGVVALFCSSCGRHREKVYPVEGKVLYDNKPAAGAIVFLHPETDEFVPGSRPLGRVDDDGVFRITTYKPSDGAAAGKYKATIYWQEPGRGDSGRMIPLGRYSDPVMSPLVVEVKEGPNVVGPFQLTRE